MTTAEADPSLTRGYAPSNDSTAGSPNLAGRDDLGRRAVDMLTSLLSTMLYMLSWLPGFERELRVLALLVRRGDTVVDLGAALGVYSVPLAALVGRDGTVEAFEPRPSAAQRLGRLARWLRLPMLRVHTVAVGSSNGTDTVVVPGRRWSIPGRSYLAGGARHHEHHDGLVLRDRHQTKRITLDTHFESSTRRVSFIKCDVEGGELDVLRGAQQTLTTDRPIVLCEIEEQHAERFGHTVQHVVEFLADCGYERIDLGPLGSADGRNQLWAPAEELTSVRTALLRGCRTLRLQG